MLTHTHTQPEGLQVSQLGRSLRHTSPASQFCLFKDHSLLLGKSFWRRARAARISKSLVSHQNRCNFILLLLLLVLHQAGFSLPLTCQPRQ